MDALIELIHVDHALGSRLAALGIASIDDMRLATASAAAQQALAVQLGVTSSHVQRWGNRAVMAQISGLGTLYVHLLCAAGITTVEKLALADADTLARRLALANRQHKIVRRLPTDAAVAEWIAAAHILSTQAAV